MTPAVPHPEKCLEEIHLHLGESLKRDLQDLAMSDNRAVGEYLRAVLELHVYGHKARLLQHEEERQAR